MKPQHHQFPDQPTTIINDDGTAQTIMLQLGVWDQISKTSRFANMSAILSEDHPTHWCICARFWNNPDPKENGFSVIAYSKKSVDILSANLALQNLLKGSSEVSVTAFEKKEWD